VLKTGKMFFSSSALDLLWTFDGRVLKFLGDGKKSFHEHLEDGSHATF